MEISPIQPLPVPLDECSGAVWIDDELLLVNDGGNTPDIHRLSSDLSEYSTILLSDIVNNDWEALAYDGEHIIIADTGNNKGLRDSLYMHWIAESDYSVVRSLSFALPGMPASDPMAHNFDIEAVTVVNDEIIICTKNRADTKTDIYITDKNLSNLTKKASVEVPAMVTDVSYHPPSESLILLCNQIVGTSHVSYITTLSIDNDTFTLDQSFPLNTDDKLEAITWKEENTFFIGSEAASGGKGMLYELKVQ